MKRRSPRRGALGARLAGAVAALLLGAAAHADVPLDRAGAVESLPPAGAHWAAVGAAILRRTSLVDLDSGRFLGSISSGWGVPDALFAERRGEWYALETHYSRGSRGDRTDVLTVYDPTTLAPGAEVVLPPKRAILSFAGAVSGLTDDERFALVWNLTPATSVTVVDLDARAVAGVIETPGCSLVYPAGARRFAQLCMNGSLQIVALDDAGHEATRQRLPAFFDPETDPVMEKGVRVGTRWLFPSFEGVLHEIDLSAAEPAFESWPLVSEADRAAGWRVGGVQPVAAHAGLGRLYVLAHEGGPGSHKEPGTELWVYDLAARERVQRIVLENQGFTFLSFPLVPPSDLASPLAALMRWGLDQVSAGIAEVAVTQDASPILVTGGGFSGGLALYDAASGEFLRRVYTGNATNLGIHTPFGGAR